MRVRASAATCTHTHQCFNEQDMSPVEALERQAALKCPRGGGTTCSVWCHMQALNRCILSVALQDEDRTLVKKHVRMNRSQLHRWRHEVHPPLLDQTPWVFRVLSPKLLPPNLTDSTSTFSQVPRRWLLLLRRGLLQVIDSEFSSRVPDTLFEIGHKMKASTSFVFSFSSRPIRWMGCVIHLSGAHVE